MAAVRAQKAADAKVKKDVINKFDGLIHAPNGDLIDPMDHHVVHITDSES